jgi:sugar (pentulose or hexulose) kinase
MSYLVTGRLYSDITSIGCHTGLWNFPQNHYYEWLFREGINDKLAPIFPSDQLMTTNWQGNPLLAGVGLHDSSAALIPYLSNFTEPFVLISTGTWCISLNPFNQSRLTVEELQQDCLCYMEYRGKPIKASRLFAGYEHEQQVKRLADHFNTHVDTYKSLAFDSAVVAKLSAENTVSDNITDNKAMMQESAFGQRDLHLFADYATAYHQLMMDIMNQQVVSTRLVLKNCQVKRIFVDGGFGKNVIYMNLMASRFQGIEVYAASVAQASAIGAALAGHHYWNKDNQPPGDLIELKQYAATQAIEL